MSQTAPSQVETGTAAGQTAKDSQTQKAKNEKNRHLSKQYRDFNYQLKRKGEDVSDPTQTHLEDMIVDINILGAQVERPHEQADDSEAFHQLAIRGAEMSKRVAAGKGRTVNDFLRHLKAIYAPGSNAQDDEINQNAFKWDRLGRDTSIYFYQAPGASCLLGPLDQIPKPKKQAVRLAKKPVGKAVAPTELTSETAQNQEKRETERNMENMAMLLRKYPDGVGYLELTMNMNSFAQFAENCFTLAFLVNAKRARFAKSEPNNQRGIMVFPNRRTKEGAKETDKEAEKDEAKHKSQMVLAYDMQDWQEWKQFVKPEDCVMPHREELDDETEAQETQQLADAENNPATQLQTQTPETDNEDENIASRKRKSLLLGQADRKDKAKKGQHRLSKAS